jgi:N-acetylmuramic acid 6-phosphate etherase
VPDYAQLATEAANPRTADLDQLAAPDLVDRLLDEEAVVVAAVRACREPLSQAIEQVAAAFARGGRLIYAGAGTSGRLGVLDASECPPTFSADRGQVVALIAGGPRALRQAVEGAEDDPAAGRAAVEALRLRSSDVVCGISASGVTPFVGGALDAARAVRAGTVLITCAASPTLRARIVIAPQVGPEALTGSTRLKAGTATKLVLNALTTGAFTLAGKVYGNLMVDVRPTNRKLRDRARRIVGLVAGVDEQEAAALLERAGYRPKVALVMDALDVSAAEAERRLHQAGGRLRTVLERGGTASRGGRRKNGSLDEAGSTSGRGPSGRHPRRR